MSSSITTRLTIASLARQSRTKPESLNEALERTAEIPDEVIMEGVREGDRDAFSLLFRRYAHRIRNIGRRILGDYAEADDLIQEVFLYIYRRSTLFDSSKGSARSWIVQVTYTQAFLRRRLLKSKGFYVSAIADKVSESDLQAYSGAEYDQSVEGLFGRNSWHKALETLSEEQRETLRLHFFEGYTFAEIAEKLNQTHANVRHHHYRGLEKLRKQLGEGELNKRSST